MSGALCLNHRTYDVWGNSSMNICGDVHYEDIPKPCVAWHLPPNGFIVGATWLR